MTHYPHLIVHGPVRGAELPASSPLGETLWLANLQLRQIHDDRARARNFFVRRQDRQRVLLPGTVILEAQPGYTEVRILGRRFTFSKFESSRVTLGVQYPHEKWRGLGGDQLHQVPLGSCVMGELVVKDTDSGRGGNWRDQFPHVRDANGLTLHAGGISFLGRPELSWMPVGQLDHATWKAPLIATVPRPVTDANQLLLSLDRDLLQSPRFTDAREYYTHAFEELRRIFNARTAFDDPASDPLTHWCHLNLTDDVRIPNFWWDLTRSGSPDDSPPIQIGSGAALLTLADRRADPAANFEESPRSTLTLDPPLRVDFDELANELTVEFNMHRHVTQLIESNGEPVPTLEDLPAGLAGHLRIRDGSLVWSNGRRVGDVEFAMLEAYLLAAERPQALQDAGGKLLSRLQQIRQHPDAEQPTMEWSFATNDDDGEATESLSWHRLTMVYDPVEAADFLRTAQDIDRPDPDEIPADGFRASRVNPAVLWGMTPLNDGWATLPFLNLTEEIAARILPTIEVAPRTPLASGAAIIGNDDDRLWTVAQEEHRWNVTLFDAEKINGRWVFQRPAAGPSGSTTTKFALQSARLTLVRPETAVNGLLWLSTDRPKLRDALPELDAWPSALRRLPLRSVSDDFPVPSPWRVDLDDGQALRVIEDTGPMRVRARLNAWTLHYRRNHQVLERTIQRGGGGRFSESFDIGSGQGGVPVITRSHPMFGRLDFERKTASQIVLRWHGITLQETDRDWIAFWINDTDIHPAAKGPLRRLETHFKDAPIASVFEMYLGDDYYNENEQLRLPLLVWKRHHSLPSVQSLPLTQALRPPSWPASGRQFAPLQWPAIITDVPTHSAVSIPEPIWTLTAAGDNAAETWPRAIDITGPADAWIGPADHADQAQSLPMAVLSVPGISLHPASAEFSVSPLSDDFSGDPDSLQRSRLDVQYAFGLPVLHEVHALASTAELPNDQPPTTVVQTPSTDADSVAADAAVVLTPETFADHWLRLAEQGFLALSDREYSLAETAISDNGDPTPPNADVVALVEPYRWDVIGETFLGRYPGSLVLTDGADSTKFLRLGREEEDSPLRGFDGWFDIDNFDRLRLTDDAGRFRVIAGAMNAVAEPLTADEDSEVGLRDQRGLVRGPTVATDSQLLRTPLVLSELLTDADRAVELITLTSPLTLTAGDHEWDFWFSSLPAFDHDGTERFLRVMPNDATPAAHPMTIEDVNDPLADTREHAHLTGYEWRLFSQRDADAPVEFSLGLLSFYPLTLERVVLDGNAVSEVVFHGRLQLPLEGGGEDKQSANTVRAIFRPREVADDSAPELELQSVELIDGLPIHWPLIDHPGAARLVARELSWDTVAKAVKVSSAHLHLTPWNLDWSPEIETSGAEPHSGPLVFSSAAIATLQRTVEGPAPSADSGQDVVRVASTELRLFQSAPSADAEDAADSATPAIHHVWLRLTARWGELDAARLMAGKSLSIVGELPSAETFARLEDPTGGPDEDNRRSLLVDDRSTPPDDLSRASLQIAFEGFESSDSSTFLLPAMKLSDETSRDGKKIQGFAAMSFTPFLDEHKQLRFHRCGGVAEMVVHCDWGRSLQSTSIELAAFADEERTDAEIREAVFGSSSGNISAGLVIRVNVSRRGNSRRWDSNAKASLLLNGLIEVCNLISWPTQPDDLDDGRFRFPAVDGATEFHHLRHTARILLNQIRVDDEMLQSGRGNVLFTLGTNPDDTHGEANDGEEKSQAFQFPAVVEHQIVVVDINTGMESPSIGPQWRWTISQEVRFARPDRYREFLNEFHDPRHVRTTELELHHGNHAHFSELEDVAMGVVRKSSRDALAGHDNDEGELSRFEHDRDGNLVDRLIVDVSAATCVLADGNRLPFEDTNRGEVPLQFLPGSTTRARLALRDDYESREPSIERWIQITLPFLGRLQDANDDGLEIGDAMELPETLLQMDPIDRLARFSEKPDLLLNLTSRLERAIEEERIEAFDTVTRRDPDEPEKWSPGRSWSRLDPTTLEQSWFRLLELPDEAGATASARQGSVAPVASVLAALPQDSPARQSRRAALTSLLDPRRATWPPDSTGRAEVDIGHRLQWRYGALLTFRGRFISNGSTGTRRLAFWPTGHRLSGLIRNLGTFETSRRLIAVNLLPPELSGNTTPPLVHPVSYAVSPYQSVSQTESVPMLALQAPASDPPTKDELYDRAVAMFADVVALDERGAEVTVVMSRLWQRSVLPSAVDSEDTAVQPTTAMPNRDDVSAWAQLTLQSLAEDSRLGVVRVRLVLPGQSSRADAEGNANALAGGRESADPRDVWTTFDFLTLSDALPELQTAQRSSPLRADVVQLRFADGHRRLTRPPAAAEPHTAPDGTTTVSSLSFAPIQVANVQPVYVPDLLNDLDPDPVPYTDYSGTRFDLRSTAGAGLSEQLLTSTSPSDEDDQTTTMRPASLWWHGARHAIRFAQPNDESTSSLLPAQFRAPVIRSFLTSVPDLVWPDTVGEPTTSDGWQAILPAAWSWTVVGSRPGAFFGYQHALTRQSVSSPSGAGTAALADVQSTIVPVQHRAVRPVPLPPNQPLGQNTAVAPWGRYFQLNPPAHGVATHDHSVDARDTPHDNILLMTDDGATGLVATLERFVNDPDADPGMPDTWIQRRPDQRTVVVKLRAEADSGATPWDFTAFLDDGNSATPPPPVPELSLSIGEALLPFEPLPLTAVDVSSDEATLTYLPANDAAVVEALAAAPHGASLVFGLSIPTPNDLFKHNGKSIKSVRYALTLPTRFVRTHSIPLPLRPQWCAFEDPQYNRQLATTAVRAEGGGKVADKDVADQTVPMQVLLAADRQDYNIETPLFVMFTTDLGHELFSPDYADDKLKANVVVKIHRDDSVDDTLPPVPLLPRELLLLQTKLPEFGQRVQPGDEVVISLTFDQCPSPSPMSPGPSCVIDQPSPEITIRIVQEDVTPTPDSAYGLLRSDSEARDVVECRRFAWSPEPNRIELVNPADLLTGTVRRRAAFRWEDVSRPGPSQAAFTVQKTLANGSTLVPDFPDS
ncbi:MAG: hypothetical protein AAGG48_26955 [Planctomycetota bacterium]